MSLTRTQFWFLRHGETDWNADNLAQGGTDIPLNARGRVQAETAAQVLRNRSIAAIVASPLSRAHDTAKTVAATLGLDVHLDERLREVSFGVLEGQPMTGWFPGWVDGTFTPEGGETFPDLRQRALNAINHALLRPAPVLVVAHGALFRAIRAEMGIDPHVRTPNATPYWCEPVADGWELTAFHG